jgi:AcrR family transcriptional regulator
VKTELPSTVRDLRRQQIVATARALVAEGGLEALTIGALEARLSFSRGVITYHFRDKDEIVASVLEDAVAEIDAATLAEVRATGGFADKVHAVLDSKVRGFLDHPEAAAILLVFWTRLGRDPRASELNTRLFDTWRRQGASLLQAGQAAGIVRPDVSPEVIAALLVGNVLGIVIQARFEPPVDVPAMTREAATAIAMSCLAR